MTVVEEMGEFVARATWEDLSEQVRKMLKVRVLDSIGCALGALQGGPGKMVRAQIHDFGGNQLCSRIGGTRTSPDYAALHSGALIRYLDFNDSYLAPGETGHPSDNIAPVLQVCLPGDGVRGIQTPLETVLPSGNSGGFVAGGGATAEIGTADWALAIATHRMWA